MRKHRGFTLIELLVTVTIAAILLGIGVPSFLRFIKSNSMSSAVNSFLADARFARSESVRLGGRVILCRSDDPEASPPTCAANNSTSGGKGWATGWVIFHDKDADDAVDAGEVLRIQPPLSSMDKVEEGTPANSTKLKFTATGRLHDATLATKMVFGGDYFGSSLQRVVCLGPGGRARVAGNGSASCGTSNE